MFAVVTIAGKQYTVSPQQILVVDRLEGKVGETLTFADVLLTGGEGKTAVGTPTVTSVKVKAKIVGQEKGDKIEVRRFKSKVRSRRHIGFRPSLTRLEILSVGRP